MALNLSSEGYERADQIGGDFLSLPGKYHVVIESAEETTNDKGEPKVIVTFVVLNGTTPGQAGKKFSEHFSFSEKAVPRLLRLAMVIGLLGPNERKSVDFSQAVGHDLIVEVDEQEYQGKKRIRATFAGFWTVGHTEVASVPIDRKSLEVYRKGLKEVASATAAQADAEEDAFGEL